MCQIVDVVFLLLHQRSSPRNPLKVLLRWLHQPTRLLQLQRLHQLYLSQLLLLQLLLNQLLLHRLS
jgi:hypothetical protein